MGDFDVVFLKRSRMRDMTEQNSPIPSDLLYPLVVGHLTFEKVTVPPTKKGHKQNGQVYQAVPLENLGDFWVHVVNPKTISSLWR